MDISSISKIIVHAGIMHADDVFVAAYINILKNWLHQEPVQVIRTFKVYPEQDLDHGYLVADIGGGQFDHHFPEEKKQKRADGIPYAAFGLVVKAFHDEFLTEEEYKLLDKKFIEPLDYHDNRGGINMLSSAIGSFNKNWDDTNSDTDKRFMDAVSVAEKILDSEIASIRSLAHAKAIADSAKIECGTIYLEKYVPIAEFFASDDRVNFIGSPSIRGGYQIVSVKDSQGGNKKLFPEYLRGFNPGEGIYNEVNMNFCHSSGFMAVFKDESSAREFMELYHSIGGC